MGRAAHAGIGREIWLLLGIGGGRDHIEECAGVAMFSHVFC